ncbi:MAG: carbohydrate transporter substrate-binding protein family [Chthonomonadales bacterium]|nr:carbohydrate transporter substrate-binding protein family [Chthonomonadales bacterium]
MQLRDFALPLMGLGILLTIAASERVTNHTPPPGPVHIAYWEKWTGFEGDAMQAVVNAFNKKQNKIYVDLLTVSGIENKTLLAVAGGDPPDVAGLFGPNMAQYADDNAIMRLDDFCRQKGIQESDYIPVYWDMGIYQGHLYALPSTPASTALHYNKQMLRNAGLDPEKPPQTLEEMDAMAAKITKLDAQDRFVTAGFLPAEPGWWNWGWGEVFGGRFWDGKSKITADDPGNIRAMEWVQSYSKKYGAAKLQSFRSGFGNFSSPQNAFLSSKVAMELQGVWMYNFIDQYAPNLEKPVLNWAAVPFPHPADRPDLANHTFTDEDILVIPRGAKHPNEAFEFIAYVQSQEGMELLCMGQKKHSPLSHVSPDFYAKHPNPYIKLFADMARSKNAQSPPKIAIWPEYKDELSNAFDAIALLHQTPQEALKDVQERMQPKLDEHTERSAKRKALEGTRP